MEVYTGRVPLPISIGCVGEGSELLAFSFATGGAGGAFGSAVEDAGGAGGLAVVRVDVCPAARDSSTWLFASTKDGRLRINEPLSHDFAHGASLCGALLRSHEH